MEADRQSIPQTRSGNSERSIAEAHTGPSLRHVWVRGTKHVTASDDRSWRRPAAATSCQSSVKHFEHFSTAILNWTHWRTGSQCSCQRTGDTWSRHRAPVIRHSAVFWSAWSRCISPSAIPYRSSSGALTMPAR